jgi:hypothetical protein
MSIKQDQITGHQQAIDKLTVSILSMIDTYGFTNRVVNKRINESVESMRFLIQELKEIKER